VSSCIPASVSQPQGSLFAVGQAVGDGKRLDALLVGRAVAAMPQYFNPLATTNGRSR